jgi:hypothetical protein
MMEMTLPTVPRLIFSHTSCARTLSIPPPALNMAKISGCGSNATYAISLNPSIVIGTKVLECFRYWEG